MLIRVRTDDVLVTSEPMKGRELQKWQKHHNWVMEGAGKFYHTAAILCKDIQQFPEAVEYIRKEVAEGRLYLDLHGWEHNPGDGYHTLPQEEIEEHLEKCFEYMLKEFNCLPIRWATPHGCDSEAIQNACKRFSLIWEGATDPVVDQGIAHELVRRAGNLTPLDGKIIMCHWFERGLKLYRVVQTGIYGSWDAAAEAQPELFKEGA